MTQYREILRLSSMGLSRTSIGASIGCSRNTYSDVLNRAMLKQVECPLLPDITDNDLHIILYPERLQSTARKIPDYEYIHKELARSGVTLTLLWEEYCVNCKASGDLPLGYTQFCHHYHKYADTTKASESQLLHNQTYGFMRALPSNSRGLTHWFSGGRKKDSAKNTVLRQTPHTARVAPQHCSILYMSKSIFILNIEF